ncbi:MAG: PAS domain S-box protein [Anaerolineales bacterium]
MTTSPLSEADEIATLKRRLQETEAALAELGAQSLLSARLTLESENNFRALAENAIEAIFIIDNQGLFVYANPQACHLVGYSPSDLLGMPFSYLVSDEDVQTVTERWKARLEGIPVPAYYEITIYHRSGEAIPVELSAARTEWQGQAAVMTFVHDIRNRRQVEQALAREILVNTNLAELSQTLLSSPQLKQISELVLEKAKFLTSSPHGFVGYIHPQTDQFEINAYTQEICNQNQAHQNEILFNHMPGLLGEVLEKGQSAWSNDYLHDPRLQSLPDHHQTIQRLATIPARLNHKVVGLIAVANAAAPYTIQQIETLERLADLYALGLQNYWNNQLVQIEAQRASTLAEITHSLVEGGLDTQTLIQLISQKTAAALKATCAVFLMDESTETIRFFSVCDPDPILQSVIEQALQQTNPLEGNRLIAQALQNKEEIFQPKIDENSYSALLAPSYRAVVELFGLHSLMLVPIQNDQALFGLIITVRHKSSAQFVKDDFTFLKEIAHRASLVLTNARLLNELQIQQSLLEVRVKERTAEIQAERDFALLVMNTMGQGLTVVNEEGHFTYVNPAYAHMLGYHPAEMVGKHCKEFIHSDDQALFEEIFQRSKLGEGTSYESTLIDKNHSLIPVEINSTPRFQGERFVGMITVITDLRPRKLLQERQCHLQAFREILLTVAQTFIQTTDENVDDNLNWVLQQVSEFLQVDRSYIFLFDWKRQTMTNTHEWCAEGISPQKENLQDVPNSVLPQWMDSLRKDPYILIPSVADLPSEWGQVKDILEAQEIQSLLVMPISTPDELLGFVGFDSVRTKRSWQEDEIKILTILANHLASYFERRKAELALQSSQAQYQLLAENVSDVIFTLDLNNNFTFVSPSVLNLTGYTVDEIEYIHLRDLLAPESFEAVQRFFAQEMTPQKLMTMNPATPPMHSIELELRCKNGETRGIEVRLNPFFNEQGKVAGMVGSARDISERQQAQRVLEYMATHDALTGLPNRVLFQDRLEHAIKRASRERTNLAVMLLDLDHFKRINDECGHLKGDEVLQEVARRLLSCLRESDTVARMGGDEFTIIIEDLTNPAFAERVAQKLLAVVHQPYLVDERAWEISASLGICLFPVDGEDVSSLLKNADIAMYRAKRYHNAYRFYSYRKKTKPLS